MFAKYNLSGDCLAELNTEMRFLLADARVDKKELVRFDFEDRASDKENSRVMSCIIKILRSLKREAGIQFYVNDEGFSANSTEAIFLLNKYSQFIDDIDNAANFIYVKI